MNTPKTGAACACRPGIERDNCATCEGSGEVIDFAAIRNLTRQPGDALTRVVTERRDSARWLPKKVGERLVFIEPDTGVEYRKVKPEDATIVLVTRLGLRVYLAAGGYTEKPNLCPRHPTYAAIRKPRSNCPTCLAAYQERRKESE